MQRYHVRVLNTLRKRGHVPVFYARFLPTAWRGQRSYRPGVPAIAIGFAHCEAKVRLRHASDARAWASHLFGGNDVRVVHKTLGLHAVLRQHLHSVVDLGRRRASQAPVAQHGKLRARQLPRRGRTGTAR